jgi:3-oxoacyl-[acyl-carrier protein] reductase
MTRVAIVTGAASGIGRATAELLRAEGVAVASLDKTPIDGDGSFVVDVASEDSVNSVVAEVRRTFGAIDIVVNAAGIGTGGLIADEHFVDTWRQTMDVNLNGSMYVVRACVDDLVLTGNGRIVNVASTQALTAAPVAMPYTVSKHAVVGFTRSLAVELGGRGVTANCVCPGATLTGMTEAIPAAAREKYARRHVPAGRYAQPEEIAYVIVALTDLRASYVNGAIIAVDGGLTTRGY